MIARTLLIVAGSLRRYLLRTVLSILGVSVGIAAVIGTAALGATSADRVQAQIDGLGEDFIWIRAGNRNVGGVRTGAGGAPTLTTEDAEALRREIPELTMCSPQLTGREQIVTTGRNWNARYSGVSPDFFQIRRRTFSAGTAFSEWDVANATRVVVLGAVVATELFGDAGTGDSAAIGQTVRIGRFPYTVVGVLASKGAGRGGLDRDDAMFLPVTTASRLLSGRRWVNDVMCAVSSPNDMRAAEVQIASLLRVRHGLPIGAPDDFEIQRPLETLQLRAQTASTMQWLLVAIGSVSLVVGGVGIMNIMLVAVTERRQEIGMRLAIGARIRDIRRQFMLEAAAIGFAGGISGIALGWVMTLFWEVGTGVALRVSSDVAVGAMAVAMAAGLVFGYVPAHRASSLDPIDAIRADT